ncbi:MAG: hypothetical protein HON14_04380 [Rhodospirillaceae bacterium]|jgi:hypothetical protein|nr:hypothetical protein [Rhodospirillaceae bacterium]
MFPMSAMERVEVLRHVRAPGAEYLCLGIQMDHAHNNRVPGEVFEQVSVN